MSDSAGRKVTDGLLNLNWRLAAKIGSLIVHADEATAPGGHTFDVSVLRTLIADPDVQEWLNGLRSEAMIPMKRSDR